MKLKLKFGINCWPTSNEKFTEYYYYLADNYIGLTIEQTENEAQALKVGTIDPANIDGNLEFDELEENVEIIFPQYDVEIVEDPRYSIKIWNLHKRVMQELARTNNSLEAFNGVFKVINIEFNLNFFH